MKLEWDGDTLYSVDAGVKIEVGYIQQSALHSERWEVYVGGRLLHIVPGKAIAQRLLEGYAL